MGTISNEYTDRSMTRRNQNYWLLIVLMAVTAACGSGPPASYYHLPDGTIINIEGRALLQLTNGDRFLQLKYQTSIPIENKEELRAQAEEIWKLFEPEVEAAEYNRASLLAANKPTVYGISTRNVYIYYLYRQVNGSWSWGTNKEISG